MENVTNKKKLSAGVIGVSLSVIIFWLIGELTTLQVPTEVAGAGGSALTWFASLLIPDDMEA